MKALYALITFAIMCLVSCDDSNVERDQSYQMPDFASIEFRQTSEIVITEKCGQPARGCIHWVSDHKVWVLAVDEYAAEEEFDHFIYGPEHK